MRKFFSSLIILSVFFLCFWSLSAWFFGKNNRDELLTFLERNQQDSDAFIHLNMKEFSSSIFGTNGILIASLNEKYSFHEITKRIPNELQINFNFKNGPVLYNKTGLSIGKSAWRVTIDEQYIAHAINNDIASNNKTFLKQSPTAYFKHSFDNFIEYSLVLKQFELDLLIKGKINTKSNNHTGSITSKKILINEDNITAKLSNLELKYKSVSKDLNGTNVPDKFYLRTKVPELTIKHKKMESFLNLSVIHNGKSTFNGNTFDSENTIELTNLKKRLYPIDDGLLDIKVNNLNISKITKLFDQFGYIKNLQQQSHWVLEEQGELPEGQDKIWQLQDQSSRHREVLVDNVEKVLISNKTKKPVFTFFLLNQFKNKQSRVNGYIDVIDNSNQQYQNNELIFSNLTQVNANVSLDKLLYAFMSKQIPINKNQFKLTYKNNQLLME